MSFKKLPNLHLPWWLRLYWYDYLAAIGLCFFVITLVVPIPDLNSSNLVPSMLSMFFVFVLLSIFLALSGLCLLTGFLATGWRIGSDINNNKAPVVIYFILEIYFMYAFDWFPYLSNMALTLFSYP